MIGNTLGHYEIVEKLGSGGMGDVYRARDTKLDRDVALKLLPTESARDPQSRIRFEREARAIARLKHPNIVRVYGMGRARGMLYIASEFVDGRDLYAELKQKGLVDIDWALAIVHDVAAGLDHRARLLDDHVRHFHVAR